MNSDNGINPEARQSGADECSWQELYRSAIYETDGQRGAERIAQAEREIITRTRVLFHQANDAVSERSALDAALYALRVLKTYSRVKILA
jgi:hypothetical protein